MFAINGGYHLQINCVTNLNFSLKLSIVLLSGIFKNLLIIHKQQISKTKGHSKISEFTVQLHVVPITTLISFCTPLISGYQHQASVHL